MEKSNYKILIVEDDLNTQEMYKIKFLKEWFDVLTSNNWLDSLTKLSDFKPDIILLDIMMPSMDWFETLRAIKELTTTINSKIIICSNLNDKKNILKWFEIWADDYVFKANITPGDLYLRVMKLLW